MNHGIGVKLLVDVVSSETGAGRLNDDLAAAELAMAQQRVSLRVRLMAGVRRGVSAVTSLWTKRTETLDEALARLETMSPHLLDDIGMAPTQPATYIDYVPAGRGLVRTELVRTEAAPAKPGSEKETFPIDAGRLTPFSGAGLAPAE